MFDLDGLTGHVAYSDDGEVERIVWAGVSFLSPVDAVMADAIGEAESAYLEM